MEDRLARFRRECEAFLLNAQHVNKSFEDALSVLGIARDKALRAERARTRDLMQRKRQAMALVQSGMSAKQAAKEAGISARIMSRGCK